MATHLKYGGSTAGRTIQCPAWQKLSQEVPFTLNGGGNPAADEGSMLHNCMEHIYGEGYHDIDTDEDGEPMLDFLFDMDISDYKGQKLTPELIETKLKPAFTAVEELMEKYDLADWVVEPFVKISDDMGGSIDLLGISGDNKTAVVVDYKFGFNTVRAIENPQGQFYALAAATDPVTSDWFGPELEKIIIVIIQPNNDGDDMDIWETNLNQIDFFETQYLTAVDNSEDPEAMPKSGAYCKYCPAEAVCPVKTGVAMAATRVNELTADKLAEYLPMAEEVEAWAKAVKKMAHEQLELGTAIKGYKLVNKRASRVWNDTAAVEDKVRKAKKLKLADGFNHVLKSPAQLEKVCKELGIDFKKTYAPMLSAVSSGTTMAKESDKRSAVIPFAGLDQLNKMNGG